MCPFTVEYFNFTKYDYSLNKYHFTENGCIVKKRPQPLALHAVPFTKARLQHHDGALGCSFHSVRGITWLYLYISVTLQL